jgi:hypothetical protein
LRTLPRTRLIIWFLRSFNLSRELPRA